MEFKEFFANLMKETYERTVEDNLRDTQTAFRHFAKLCTLLLLKGGIDEEELQILYRFDATDEEFEKSINDLQEKITAKRL